jgi:acetyl esterase/lipase
MARFPPTLLISSTRDFAMSATLATHQQLVALEKVSELHIYEGLIHYFFADTELTESQQAFAVMSRFFHQHLNRATPAIALSSEQ